MRALSIQQPWAFCITDGTKRVENRTWSSSHRGDLLIHTGKTYQTGVELGINADSPEMDIEQMKAAPRGGFVGYARMTDCVRAEKVPEAQQVWAGGPWCFVFDDVRRFSRLLPYPGDRGVFEVPDSFVTEALLEVDIVVPGPATGAAEHHCHAIGCGAHVPPRLVMCAPHWRLVPRKLQKAIWSEYAPGQETRKDPTPAYRVVQAEAVLHVAIREGIDRERIDRQRATLAFLRTELAASDVLRLGGNPQLGLLQ